MSRASIVTQFLALAFVVVLVVRFSAGSPSDAVVYDQARDLQQAVSQAVAATNNAVLGTAPPQLAAEAIDQASTASRQLAATRTNAESAQLRSLATQMVSAADQVLAQLSQGAVDRAEELRANRLVPLASEIAMLKGSASATTQAPGSSEFGIVVAVGIIAVVVGGVALLARGRSRPVEASTTVVTDRPAPASSEEQPQHPKWDAPHPLYGDQTWMEPTVSESADIARTTRMRPVDIEMQSLLEATVEQAQGREWTVNVVCPEVHVSGDPVRVQRAILATLGKAFLEGAGSVTILVEAVRGQVLLSIGHDAPIDDHKAEDIADRLASQLAAALDKPELGWSVAADGALYITTVSAGEAQVIESGAEVSA